MFRSLLCLLSVSLPLLAQTPTERPAPVVPKVEVPTFANATCPIMGKKVSMSLFVDTELGRFYVCCKPCFKKIQADLPTAHTTAYPVVQDAKNTTCPVSGEAIGAHAVTVTLQAHRVALCCSGCEAAARQHSQVTLVKATRAVADVGNTTCPITSEPVVANAFVVVGDALVHLSSPKAVDEVAKDPAAALAKARAIAKAQPPKPKHEHVPAKGDKPAPGSSEAGK